MDVYWKAYEALLFIWRLFSESILARLDNDPYGTTEFGAATKEALDVREFSPFMVVDHEAHLADFPVLLGNLNLQVIARQLPVILEAAQVNVASDTPLAIVLGHSLRVVGEHGHIKIIDFAGNERAADWGVGLAEGILRRIFSKPLCHSDPDIDFRFCGE